MSSSDQSFDIEIYEERSDTVYVFVILMPSGNLDTVYSRRRQETVLSITPSYEVPDLVQLTFYRERNKILNAIKH